MLTLLSFTESRNHAAGHRNVWQLCWQARFARLCPYGVTERFPVHCKHAQQVAPKVEILMNTDFIPAKASVYGLFKNYYLWFSTTAGLNTAWGYGAAKNAHNLKARNGLLPFVCSTNPPTQNQKVVQVTWVWHYWHIHKVQRTVTNPSLCQRFSRMKFSAVHRN